MAASVATSGLTAQDKVFVNGLQRVRPRLDRVGGAPAALGQRARRAGRNPFLQTWRASIIPLLAVPVAVVGSFGVMHLFGFSTNALSLFGLVLAIGIVVDDAIVVDSGRREAGVQNANALWDAAAATDREQVLTAFQDVEDQLAALRLLAAQTGAQGQAVGAARRATRLSDVRNGLVSQLEPLDARRSELANRREAVQWRSAQYQATVGLIRALGGGWRSAPG